MKKLVIIGAGGMGRSIYNLAMQCDGYNRDYEIKGFIDDNLKMLDDFDDYPSILGKITSYQVLNEDVFVNSLGCLEIKKRCVEVILNNGGKFINLIHPLAIILKNVVLGNGCVIFPFASLGADSSVGDFTLIQNGAIIGHDVTIGNWSRIDNYVVIVGGVIVGNKTNVHTGAVINHNVTIHDNATVGACSFVIRDVKEGTTVFGNPAKKL